MAPKYKFHEGEKVLCFHGPILYEAKCVKIQAKDKNVKYFVHYQGWNKSWDEWVPEGRVLKYNEINVQKQKELQEAHNSAVKPKSKSSRKRNSGDKDGSSTPKIDKSGKPKSGTLSMSTPDTRESGEKETGGKKRRTKVDQTTEEDIQNLPEVRILVPDELKTILKEDWEMINKNNSLLMIPSQQTVDDILEDYVNYKKKESSLTPPKVSIIFEMTNGIREYFNVVLGNLLLYKSERAQYEKVTKDGDDEILPSSVYGFIHLLRLFVKFGNLLAHSHTDEKSLQFLIPYFDDFISFCATNAVSYKTKEEYTPLLESPKK